MPHTVLLALGSNLGDRAANLRAAINGLAPAAWVQRVSAIYETEPWGYTDQPAFFNQVLCAQTELEPEKLLDALKRLENSIGRVPNFRNGPRLIDVDILSYDNQVVDQPALNIPHTRLHERAFVLVPLAEIAPDWIHPRLQASIQSLLTQIDTAGVKKTSLPVPLFPWGARTYVMGILNITPDSFSGDGLLKSQDVLSVALDQARRFAASGADILDIGAESTRPGSQPVEAAEELERILPIVERLVKEDLGVILSIDTYKAEVAQAALRAGAHWINDVWGLQADPDLAIVAARHHAPVVLMHNRSKPSNAALEARLGGRYVGVQYNNLLEDVSMELMHSVDLAHKAGIPDEHIILDPGIGFGKTVEQNLVLLNHLDQIKKLGYPVLLGPSRKSFIGYTLNLPPTQRVEGTAAACALGIQRGADILRVHDVEAVVRTARMTDAILHTNLNP